MSWLFASGGQNIGVSVSASVLPMNIQDWFPLGLTGMILQPKGLSWVFSSTKIWKHHLALSFLYGTILTSIVTTGKSIALTLQTPVSKVMFLLFNMLSRLAIIFLPRSKRLLISCLQWPSKVILKPKERKSVTVSIFPSICHEVMGPDVMIFNFWMLSFKPAFSLSSFTFIKMLFRSSSPSAVRVVSSAYLRLLIFLPVILTPACDVSSLAFHMIYSYIS